MYRGAGDLVMESRLRPRPCNHRVQALVLPAGLPGLKAECSLEPEDQGFCLPEEQTIEAPLHRSPCLGLLGYIVLLCFILV